MKKQYFINANIIDPHNSINENGGLIIGEDGLIEAIGKKVNSNNIPSREKVIDLNGKNIYSLVLLICVSLQVSLVMNIKKILEL